MRKIHSSCQHDSGYYLYTGIPSPELSDAQDSECFSGYSSAILRRHKWQMCRIFSLWYN